MKWAWLSRRLEQRTGEWVSGHTDYALRSMRLETLVCPLGPSASSQKHPKALCRGTVVSLRKKSFAGWAACSLNFQINKPPLHSSFNANADLWLLTQWPIETCYFLPGGWKEKSPQEKPSRGPGSGSRVLGVQLPHPSPLCLPSLSSLGPHVTSSSG